MLLLIIRGRILSRLRLGHCLRTGDYEHIRETGMTSISYRRHAFKYMGTDHTFHKIYGDLKLKEKKRSNGGNYDNISRENSVCKTKVRKFMLKGTSAQKKNHFNTMLL